MRTVIVHEAVKWVQCATRRLKAEGIVLASAAETNRPVKTSEAANQFPESTQSVLRFCTVELLFRFIFHSFISVFR
jgi:hypothetical protein